MLEEIHLAGGVRTSLGSFCGVFADVSAKSHYPRLRSCGSKLKVFWR